MACKLAANCDLIFGILTSILLGGHYRSGSEGQFLWGIHMYKKDRSTQAVKCSPWGTEVKPFPSLQKKMTEYLRQRQIIATPFSNRSYQPRPKTTPIRRSNLVTLTRTNREKLSQCRKVNVGPISKAKQRNWLATVMAKEAEATASSQAPAPTQPVEVPAAQSPTLPLCPDTRYCAVCTPLEKLCPNEYPITLDCEEKEE